MATRKELNEALQGPSRRTRFELDIDRFARMIQQSAVLMVRQLSLMILRGVVLNSPVKSGLFRSNWQVGVNRNIDTTTTNVVGSEVVVSRGMSRIGQITETPLSVWINNNLPYARRLENGWSAKAPKGVVAPTMLAIEAEMRAVLERVLTDASRENL